ncbi:hypothetical protein Pint_20106 [Pistacia integerrima]|uniref:Uncharacterized protein n=1 Tax=Pistacia integerrima TaxID=434235 RepID=A0ACC0XBD5_9ROSI|nr:hypothetical protein Pint_20106 [Pistacia integerrima]
MIDTPILALLNFSIPFVLETDASSIGIGAVLMQNHHPITFYSRKLSKTMQGKSTYIREMFAITSIVAKWHQYLFIIQTDHKSLHNLLTQTIQTPKQQQFLSKLLGFRYTIVYKPDASNALSQAQDLEAPVATGQLFSLSYPTSSDIVVLEEELVQDQYAKQIIDELQNNPGN